MWSESLSRCRTSQFFLDFFAFFRFIFSLFSDLLHIEIHEKLKRSHFRKFVQSNLIHIFGTFFWVKCVQKYYCIVFRSPGCSSSASHSFSEVQLLWCHPLYLTFVGAWEVGRIFGQFHSGRTEPRAGRLVCRVVLYFILLIYRCSKCCAGARLSFVERVRSDSQPWSGSCQIDIFPCPLTDKNRNYRIAAETLKGQSQAVLFIIPMRKYLFIEINPAIFQSNSIICTVNIE